MCCRDVDVSRATEGTPNATVVPKATMLSVVIFNSMIGCHCSQKCELKVAQFHAVATMCYNYYLGLHFRNNALKQSPRIVSVI